MHRRVDRYVELLISLVIGLLIALVAVLPHRYSWWVTLTVFFVGAAGIGVLLLYRQEYIFTGPKPRMKKYEKGESKEKGDIVIDHKGGCQGNSRGIERRRIRLGGRDIQAISFKVSSPEPYWRAGVELASEERQRAEMNMEGSLLFHIGRNGIPYVYPDPQYGLQHLQDKYAVIAYCNQSMEATSPLNRLGKGDQEQAPIIPEQVLGSVHEPGQIFQVDMTVTGPVAARTLTFSVKNQSGQEVFREAIRNRVASGYLKNCYLLAWADEKPEPCESREHEITFQDIKYRAFPKV